MPFKDRVDAGRKLAKALASYKDQKPVVLALPRGGVPVAAEIATALEAPLDLVLVRKIGVPFQPELAMGAVVDGATPVTVRNEDVIALAGISDAEFDSSARPGARRDRAPAHALSRRAAAPAARRPHRHRGRRRHRHRRHHPRRPARAAPAQAAPAGAGGAGGADRKPREPAEEADDVVCLEDYEDFGAIGFFYADFRQMSDDEVIALLAAHPVETQAKAKDP